MRPLTFTFLLWTIPACYPDIRAPVQADEPFDADVQPADGPADVPIDGVPPIDAPIDSPGDTDDDGILDTEDNCPEKGNADQRNHDGDARGDVCDGCPHIPDNPPADEDGDGIGDACDPHRGDDQDVLVHFDGFYDDLDGLPADWTAGAGEASHWQIRGGQLRNIGVNDLQLASWTKTKAGDLVVDMRMTVLPVTPSTGGSLTVGVTAGHDGEGPGPLWLCSLLNFPVNAPHAVLRMFDHLSNDEPNTGEQSDNLPFRIAAGRTSSFRIELRGLSSPTRIAQTCTLDRETAGAITVTAQDFGTANGYPGLRVRGVEAAFDYFVVYGRKL